MSAAIPIHQHHPRLHHSSRPAEPRPARESQARASWECPACGNFNGANSDTCLRCDSPRPPSTTRDHGVSDYASQMVGICVAVCVCAVGSFVFLLLLVGGLAWLVSAGRARPIYIYHKDTTSKQYESALNDSVVERVDGEMIALPALPCLALPAGRGLAVISQHEVRGIQRNSSSSNTVQRKK